MADGVLPATACPAVVGEGVTDPSVNVIQTQLPVRGRPYCHGNESGIAVRGLPFRAGGRSGLYTGWEIFSFLSFSLLLPSPLLPTAQTADSQLGEPVDAGQTGVQVRRHSLSFCPSLRGLRLSKQPQTWSLPRHFRLEASLLIFYVVIRSARLSVSFVLFLPLSLSPAPHNL